jgi:eukaryotic-like serine/threonine-protein kinase
MDAEMYPRRLGRYVLVRALGEGGMGTVDLALRPDRDGPTICVLKRLLPHLKDEAHEKRFLREGELGARFCHAGLLRTLAVDRVVGELVLVQEFLSGWDLDTFTVALRAQGRAVPLWLAAYIVREIAEALEHLHEQGGTRAIHRDVAPGNILCGFDGRVKLIDFGVAKDLEATGLTGDGWAGGRLGYAAPELCHGSEPGDRSSDVFSLGVVLWELSARRQSPATMGFGGGDSLPPPSTFNREIPKALDVVIERATDVSRDARFRSAQAFAAELTRLLPRGYSGREELVGLLDQVTDRPAREASLADEVKKAERLLSARSSVRLPGVVAPWAGPVLAVLLGLTALVATVTALAP